MSGDSMNFVRANGEFPHPFLDFQLPRDLSRARPMAHGSDSLFPSSLFWFIFLNASSRLCFRVVPPCLRAKMCLFCFHLHVLTLTCSCTRTCLPLQDIPVSYRQYQVVLNIMWKWSRFEKMPLNVKRVRKCVWTNRKYEEKKIREAQLILNGYRGSQCSSSTMVLVGSVRLWFTQRMRVCCCHFRL